MLPERDVHAGSPSGEVLVETRLASEGGAKLHSCRLMAFGVTNVGCQFGNVAGAIQRNKDDTIVVGQYKILGSDNVLATGGRRKGQGVLFIKTLRPRGQGAEAEHRQPDGPEFSGVPVQAPDHDAR